MINIPLSTYHGVVLKTSPSTKYHSIITLFTKAGLLSCFVPQGQSPKNPIRAHIVPLSMGIFHINTNVKSLRLQDVEPLGHFPNITSNLDCLIAAGKMIEGILASQLLQQPSERLYTLFLQFLHRLHEAKNPLFFASIFLLKTMQHDGYYNPDVLCSICHRDLLSEPATHASHHMYFCAHHKPKQCTTFSQQEMISIRQLLTTSSLATIIQHTNASEDFTQRLLELFFHTTQP